MRWILGALCLIVGLGSPAFAAQAGSPSTRTGTTRTKPRQMTASQRRAVLRQLNLTPDQKEAMRVRRVEYRKKMAELNAQLEVKHIELDGEMEKTNPDKEKLQRLSEDIGKIQSRKLNEETDARLDFDKILTPEQLEKWKAYKQDRKNNDSSDEMDVEVGSGSVSAH